LKNVSILIYHRVLDKPDPLRPSEVDVVRFDAQMKIIRRFFNVIPLSDVEYARNGGGLHSRALAITFDDGYLDNYTNALPVLKKYGLPATFFISTGFLENGIMWNDVVTETIRATRKSFLDLTNHGLHTYDLQDNRLVTLGRLLSDLKYLPFDRRKTVIDELPDMLEVDRCRGLMMSAENVRSMVESGMTVGAHTVNHPILSKLSLEDASSEIQTGKAQLESIVQREVNLFAYPNGKPFIDYEDVHVKIVKESGFTCAVSTSWGVASSGSDIYQLPRFTPWDKSNMKFISRLLRYRFTRGKEERV